MNDKDDKEGIAYYLLLGRSIAEVGDALGGSWLQADVWLCCGWNAMVMAGFVVLGALVMTPTPFGRLSGFPVGLRFDGQASYKKINEVFGPAG